MMIVFPIDPSVVSTNNSWANVIYSDYTIKFKNFKEFLRVLVVYYHDKVLLDILDRINCRKLKCHHFDAQK